MGAEDGTGENLFDAETPADERPAELETPVTRPMSVDPTQYYETGAAQVASGPDGLPVIAGEPPDGPEPGLSDDNFICTDGPNRPPCAHYVAIVVPAEGTAKGFGPLRRIRRFCKWLSTGMEPFELTGDFYACTARSPQDLVSLRIITDFEKKQKKQAREHAQQSGELDF